MRTIQNFRALLKRFQRDERGAFLVLFGVMALVLIATSGAVVDFTSIEQARTQSQDALDSAALGLQSTMYDTGVTEATIKDKAQLLINERLAGGSATALITTATVDKPAGKLTLIARLTIPTAFVSLVGVKQVNATIVSEVTRGSVNIEVAVALDTTGSMSGSKITSLIAATNSLIDIVVQDVQTPTYTKLALVPYSAAVNPGSYADAARGAIIMPKTVNGASWSTGSTKSISLVNWTGSGTVSGGSISAINKANPARVTTSSNHGLITGDLVVITGVSGMTQVNNRLYVVTKDTNTRFFLNGVDSTGYSTFSNSSSDYVYKCSSASCNVVVTSSSHGFADGDTVVVKSLGGMTALNNKPYVVGNKTTNTYQLSDVAATSSLANVVYTSGGTGQKCQVAKCEVVVQTSAAHGFSADMIVYISNVNGITQINNQSYADWTDRGNWYWDNGVPSSEWDNPGSDPARYWEVSSIVSTTKFTLRNSFGPSYGTYSGTGDVACWSSGCERMYFQDNDNDYTLFRETPCVTERTGAEAYTDAGPGTAYVGRNYTYDASCIGQSMMPLSTSKTDLHAKANSLVASGTTAGHIGLAWAWYMLAPNWASILPTASQPAAYPDASDADPDLIKVLILMTDGEFNTVYNNGILAQDAGTGSDWQQINADATNGNPFDQAEALCDAIKEEGIILYTVGFDISDGSAEDLFLEGCAEDISHYYLASNGAQLTAAFNEIAQNISALRVTR